MKLRGFLDHGEALLRAGPHPDRARRDAETLLQHHIGRNKAWLMAHADDDFAGCRAIGYAGLLERRQRGEPIQYIIGEAEFYGLPFRVTPDVLIPRPETEHLVEKTVNLATQLGAPSIPRTLRNGWESTNPSQPLRILDVGTGSGAIAVALAHRLTVSGLDFSRAESASKDNRPLAPAGARSANLFEITCTDISDSALAIARQNATRNAVADHIRFLQGDLLDPVAGEQFELIVSNPPYVPEADRDTLSVEVREFEPSLALFADGDGLGVYHRLIPAAFRALAPGGFIALEIGHGQQETIRNLLSSAGFSDVGFVADLQGIPRVAFAQRK
jgi:release factor glutamine methyltransferase